MKRLGSASVGAVGIIITALLIFFVLSAIHPEMVAGVVGAAQHLRRRAEASSELIRIYVHSTDGTELGEPVITLINGWDKDSYITDFIVIDRSGRLINYGKFEPVLELKSGQKVDLPASAFHISYNNFDEFAREVKGIYVRTLEGNSFGSSFGPPPSQYANLDYETTDSTRHKLVIPTNTIYRYNITFSGDLPRADEAVIQINVIVVDSSGRIWAGVEDGVVYSLEYRRDSYFRHIIWLPPEVTSVRHYVVPRYSYWRAPVLPSSFYMRDCQSDKINNPEECQVIRPPATLSYVELITLWPIEDQPGHLGSGQIYWVKTTTSQDGTIFYVGPPIIPPQYPFTAQETKMVSVTYPKTVTTTFTTTTSTRTTVSGGSTRTIYYTSKVTVTYTTTLTSPTEFTIDLLPISERKTTTWYSTTTWTSTSVKTITSTSTRLLPPPTTMTTTYTRTYLYTYTSTYTFRSTETVAKAVLRFGNELFGGQTAKLVTNAHYLMSRNYNGTQLSGRIVFHLATIEPGQMIKVNAPYIIVNYIYSYDWSPQTPSGPNPSSGTTNVSMICEVQELIRVPSEGGVNESQYHYHDDLYIWLANVERVFKVICVRRGE